MSTPTELRAALAIQRAAFERGRAQGRAGEDRLYALPTTNELANAHCDGYAEGQRERTMLRSLLPAVLPQQAAR